MIPHDLDARQHALLDGWLGEWTVTADLSWPLQETTVLRVAAGGDALVVKAHGHHVPREIVAHRHYDGRLDALLPTLVHADAEAELLVTRWLPGELVDGTRAARAPATFRKAGAALRRILEPLDVSDGWMEARRGAALRSLEEASAGRLVPEDALRSLAARLGGIRSRPVRLWMTHGDYQPRNWLLDGDALRVIDLGRAAPRPWTSDLTRMRFKDFVSRPDLEHALLDGLGLEPTADELDAQRLEDVSEAIGTVVWAHGIGDGDFEDHGRRMIDRVLGE